MSSNLEQLASAFREFTQATEKGGAHLYTALTVQIAEDPELLNIANLQHNVQLPYLMLFGSVRYLLLTDEKYHELKDFYVDLVDDPANLRKPDEAFPIFREFCLQHKTEIQHLFATRTVQTNEVGRCAVLVPVFEMVTRNSNHPLAIIEIGSSAGLNLNWDHYRYHYTGNREVYVGDLESPLELSTEVRGEILPFIPEHLPQSIASKGIDLNPLNPSDPDTVHWLHALIWPEHAERWDRLECAIKVVQSHPPTLLTGNALETLPELMNSMPSDASLCLFHSMTVMYFNETMRTQLDSILSEYSQQRDVYRISFEWEPEHQSAILRLITYEQGQSRNEMLARADPHGKWMEWIAS